MTNEGEDLKQLLKHRGDYVISKRGLFATIGWSIVDEEFDHSLLLRHIATDLISNSEEETDLIPTPRCNISECLSNYMLYLLVMYPFMLPKGIGEFRLLDTCSEAKRFVHQRRRFISSRSDACRLLMEVNTRLAPREVEGDKSKSVLFEARGLAKSLEFLEKEGKWEMVSDVCVEMLCYAANHCEWVQHGHQLRRGGDLLTHVCLLMAHLGLSE